MRAILWLGPLLVVGNTALAESCPSALKREVSDDLVDARPAQMMSPKAWHRMRWAPGHKKPPAASFWMAPEKAVESILSVEAKNPRLIPEAFRAKVAAAPRDAQVRLQVAACEVKSPETRRRGAQDAALALLLGAPKAQAMPVLEAGAGAKFRRFFCNSSMPCGKGDECELSTNRCITQDDRAFSWLSKDEIAIEDTLTRVVMRHAATGKGAVELSDAAADDWVRSMVHRCGKGLCGTSFENKKLVVWDLRDGGYAPDHAERVPPKGASRKACLLHTDHVNYGQCIDGCRRPTGSGTFISSDGCVLRCETYCP